MCVCVILCSLLCDVLLLFGRCRLHAHCRGPCAAAARPCTRVLHCERTVLHTIAPTPLEARDRERVAVAALGLQSARLRLALFNHVVIVRVDLGVVRVFVRVCACGRVVLLLAGGSALLLPEVSSPKHERDCSNASG